MINMLGVHSVGVIIFDHNRQLENNFRNRPSATSDWTTQ